MPLHDLQTALGVMVTARGTAGAGFDGLALTPEERGWLEGLAGTPGLAVTRHIGHWWRETKLRMAARLTLAVLDVDARERLIQDYLEATPCASLFFIPEALGFLDYTLLSAPEVPHLLDIARFERALLLAREAAPLPPGATPPAEEWRPEWRITPHPSAAAVAFAAPPTLLLGALLGGGRLPAPQPEPTPVLIAPGLPHLWRPATPHEAALFSRAQKGLTVGDLHAEDEVLSALLRAGALLIA